MEFPCTQQLPDDFDEAIDEVDEDEKQKKQIGILQVSPCMLAPTIKIHLLNLIFFN